MPASLPTDPFRSSQDTNSMPVPANVREACSLLLGSFLLSLFAFPTILGAYSEDANFIAALLGSVVVAVLIGGLTILFVVKIRQRRKWARFAALALVLFGALAAATTISDDWNRYPLVALIEIACVVMEACATLLLFSRAANTWFSMRNESVSTSANNGA